MLVDRANAQPISPHDSDEDLEPEQVNTNQQEEVTNASLFDEAVEEFETIAYCYRELIRQATLLERRLEARYDTYTGEVGGIRGQNHRSI